MDKKLKKSKMADTRHGGLTWDAEVRFKEYFVKKIPNFLSPHRLTYLAFIAAILAAFSYYLTNFSKWWLIAASLFIAAHWFFDVFDGTVARYRRIVQKRYGYYADHMFDMVSFSIIVLCMGLSPGMNIIWALGIIIGYFLLSINTFVAAQVYGKFKLSYGLLGPTEFRILIILINTILLFFKWPFNLFKIGAMNFTLLDVIMVLLIIALISLFIKGFIENLVYLKRIDNKNYYEMSMQDAINQLNFKIQKTELGKSFRGKNLRKEIKDFFKMFSD